MKAVRGYAILKIQENLEGAIIHPERWKRDGDVGEVVHDNTGLGIKPGAPVLVSHAFGGGTYFEHGGTVYLRIAKPGLYMTEEGAWI